MCNNPKTTFFRHSDVSGSVLDAHTPMCVVCHLGGNHQVYTVPIALHGITLTDNEFIGSTSFQQRLRFRFISIPAGAAKYI